MSKISELFDSEQAKLKKSNGNENASPEIEVEVEVKAEENGKTQIEKADETPAENPESETLTEEIGEGFDEEDGVDFSDIDSEENEEKPNGEEVKNNLGEVKEEKPVESTDEKITAEEKTDAIFSNDDDEVEDELLSKDETAREKNKKKWQKRRAAIAEIEKQLIRENDREEVVESLVKQGVESLIYKKQIIKARIDGVEKSKHGYFINCSLKTRLGILPVRIADINVIENLEDKSLQAYYRAVGKSDRGQLTKEQIRKIRNRWTVSRLKDMIGAYIEFIAIDYVDGSIVGSRTAAMQERRKAFVPTRNKKFPDMRVGSRGIARIIRQRSNFIEVEFCGYEVKMSPYQISLLAIDLNDYTVGKRFEAVVTDISDDFSKIYLIGAKGHSLNYDNLYKQYSVGTTLMADIIGYRKLWNTNFAFILRLPNGCRGYAFDNFYTLRRRPQVGDSIRVTVKNTTENRNFKAIKCEISTFATVNKPNRRSDVF